MKKTHSDGCSGHLHFAIYRVGRNDHKFKRLVWPMSMMAMAIAVNTSPATLICTVPTLSRRA